MELSSIRRCFITYRESNANTNSPTLYSNLHFNQRTRMGCDISRTKEEAHRGVSIHAPARGATEIPRKFLFETGVSIHAPARGATISVAYFSSANGVSIHAPARGATQQQVEYWQYVPVSIHAPARGATNQTSLSGQFGMFQSTHPHGVRHHRYRLVHHQNEFQSAPARGATKESVRLDNDAKFQSTHPHGVRLFYPRLQLDGVCFNPRTRTGCDLERGVVRL